MEHNPPSNQQQLKVHSPHPKTTTTLSKHRPPPDVHEIYTMIKELATYEDSEDSVQATEESLRRTLTFSQSAGHSNPGYARTLILRLPHDPDSTSHPTDTPEAVAGMAIYFNNYSTWRSKPGVYLEDLYIRPEYRKRGYGKMLLQELAREVMRIDGGRLEWSCLKWNEASLKFYRSLGAREMEGWVGLRLEGDAVEKLALGMTRVVQTGNRDKITGQLLQVNGL